MRLAGRDTDANLVYARKCIARSLRVANGCHTPVRRGCMATMGEACCRLGSVDVACCV